MVRAPGPASPMFWCSTNWPKARKGVGLSTIPQSTRSPSRRMPRGVSFCWRIAKARGIKHGKFLRPPKYRVLTRPMLRLAGWFDTTVRELYEMLYQYEFDYNFDSTKFTETFRFQPTSYAEGVRRTAQSYRQ